MIAPLTALLLAAAVPASAQPTPSAKGRATEFRLSNGMQVVVIPDHRAPVVTHMVWYRVGAADEPRSMSGVAHFLEHLMFKATERIPTGGLSRAVARLGGQDNAFTTHDATAYFQRVPKEHLRTAMAMEADRMVNLRLDEKEVLSERDVILEERRARVDGSPLAILDEQMAALLHQNHPYGLPVLGWEHEIARMSRQDALAFYKRFYAPNNAFLIVAGDVTPAEVKEHAEATFGPLKPVAGIGKRVRPQEPEQRAGRRIELKDSRAGGAAIYRYYLVPSYPSAQGKEAEAIDLLAKAAFDGSTSRLYQRLVVEAKVATVVGGDYHALGLDSGRLTLYAVAVPGQGLDTVEAALDRAIGEIAAAGLTAEEVARAQRSYLADYIYSLDSQASLARRYGSNLVVGRTVKDVEAWPDRLRLITADDVRKVAGKYLDIRRSVTGLLLPAPKPASQ